MRIISRIEITGGKRLPNKKIIIFLELFFLILVI